MSEKYFAAETSFGENEAEYDAAEYNFQVVDHSDDVIVLCPNKRIQEHVLKLLNENPLPPEA